MTETETPALRQDVLLGKHHDITPFASKESNRLVLQTVHYKADKQCVEACNGKLLIRVPVTLSDAFPQTSVNGEPKDCLIPVEQYKKALGNIPKSPVEVLNHVRLSVSGPADKQRVNLVTTDCDSVEQNVSCRPFDGTFPNTEQVIPAETPTFSIALSAHVLKTLVDYASKHGYGDAPISFYFTDACAAVRFSLPVVDALGAKVTATGVIMPMRVA